jgi:antitoxin ParD1/3/4
MPTRTVELTEDLNKFIESAVESGRFGDASEGVREGLRLLEEREAEDRAKLEWLRQAAMEAFDSLDRGTHPSMAWCAARSALSSNSYRQRSPKSNSATMKGALTLWLR